MSTVKKSSPSVGEKSPGVSASTFTERTLKLEEDLMDFQEPDCCSDAEKSEDDCDVPIVDPSENVGVIARVTTATGAWIETHKSYLIYLVYGLTLALVTAVLALVKPRVVTKKYRKERVLDYVELAKYSGGGGLVLGSLVLGWLYYTGRL